MSLLPCCLNLGSIPENVPEIPRNDLRTYETILENMKRGGVENVLTLGGFGMSRSAGVPDFNRLKVDQSQEHFLVQELQQKYYDFKNFSDLFDERFFLKNPEPLKDIAGFLRNFAYFRPTPAHWFIGYLNHRGILQRHYTLNIDGLDRKLGIPNEKLVEMNGTFEASICVDCHFKYKFAVASCLKCSSVNVRPAVRMSEQSFPIDTFKYAAKDIEKCDLVIVMGIESDTMGMFNSLVQRIPSQTPIIWIASGEGQFGIKRRKKKIFRFPEDSSPDASAMKILDDLDWLPGFQTYVAYIVRNLTK